jgi:hypothetical protein
MSMISRFIFPAESAACGEIGGLGGLTRFRLESVFGVLGHVERPLRDDSRG